MSTDKERNLYYLHELSDYKVSDSDKDVRGWAVEDKNGRKIGKVDSLLVNKNTERVVYLDVEVDSEIIAANHKPYSKPSADGVHEFLNKDGENHLIIPIGLADLNLEKEIVYTQTVDYSIFAETKRISRGTVFDRDYEFAVMNSYNRANNNQACELGDDYYERSEFMRK